jgi:hypothetical protein
MVPEGLSVAEEIRILSLIASSALDTPAGLA